MKLSEFDFRIWDNVEKKYLNSKYGLYIESDSGEEFQYTRIIANFQQREYYMDHPFNGNKKEYENDDSLTLELFTGFCDKNGNKIYEGDILYSFEDCPEDEAFKYKVVLKEGNFYLVECGDDGEEYDEDLISEFRLTELEIIGNINENAELLK